MGHSVMPLHSSIEASVRLLRAVTHGNINDVKEALQEEGRAEREATDCMVLTMAVGLAYTDIISLLLEAGLSVDARNLDGLGRTALCFAAGRTSLTIAQRLIDAGAVASIRTVKGDTPLHYFAAAGKGNVAGSIEV